MTLDDLPTPCLVLDRPILQRNIRTMAAAVARCRVPLRPHMKTAKSIDVARLALRASPAASPFPLWPRRSILRRMASPTSCTRSASRRVSSMKWRA